MTVRRRVIRRAAISSRCSFAWPALKEARACLAPALLRACIFRSCRAEQRASENVGIECIGARRNRSEEHTSELQSLMRISYAVFCLKKKKKHVHYKTTNDHMNQ